MGYHEIIKTDKTYLTSLWPDHVVTVMLNQPYGYELVSVTPEHLPPQGWCIYLHYSRFENMLNNLLRLLESLLVCGRQVLAPSMGHVWLIPGWSRSTVSLNFWEAEARARSWQSKYSSQEVGGINTRGIVSSCFSAHMQPYCINKSWC